MGIYKIIVDIESMHEIPLAYAKAIEKFHTNDEYRDKENDSGDVWDARIELKYINFEDNFRRSNYECVFEINTSGDYLERYKPKETL